MRKKIWSLVLVLVVAVCGMVFVACGGQTPGTNVSLTISSGLDSGLDSSKLLNLSNELSLSEMEKVSLGSGKGYDNKISSGKVVTLLAGNSSFESREIIVKIEGYEESMGQLINFSSDSSNITFSQVEYLSGGRAKVVITGISPGTAEVTARSGQYSKQVGFTVKVLQLPNSFSVKTDAVIYLQKNSTLTINAEDYVNFYPFTTNMRDLEFYNGTTLLTKNGITTITSIGEQPNAITGDVILTIKSTRMNTNDVQSIQVKVIDNISQAGLKKLAYLENGNSLENKYELIDKEILTVIKNSSKVYNKGQAEQFSISYGIREVYVVVQNKEVQLGINTKVLINGVETSILCLPVDYKLITENNYLSYINTDYVEILQGFIGEQSSYSFHVYKFEFQYTGYDAYNVEFSFNFENYTYPEKKELAVEFKSASNLVEFRKSTETTEYNNYTIYDSYNGVYGTRFITKTNTGTLPYTLQILIDQDVKNNLDFLSTTGRPKTPILSGDKYLISLTNGENFYIKGKEGSANINAYKLTVKVIYEHDNIVFETLKEIDFFVQRAPSSLRFNQASTGPQLEGDVSNINKYYFDLNISGNRIGADGSVLTYDTSTSVLSLYLYSYDASGKLIGTSNDFSINTLSSNISISKDENILNKINIVAKSVGTGSFTIILGNNVKNTFTFEAIQSVSQFEITFPSEDQNDNVFSLKTDYTFNDVTYNNYLIALSNKSIPVIVSKTGEVDSLSITCVEDLKNYVVYANGYLKTNEDFENKAASVNVTYKYIDNNVIKSTTIVVDSILITSITNISSFNLTTSKNSNNFNLYDYSSVGYYAKDLSTVNIYIDISPLNLKAIFLNKIVWGTNVTNSDGSQIVPEITDSTYILRTDIFVFTYYKSTGAAVLTCNITEDKHNLYYDDQGNFTGGTIVLTAKIDRGDYGMYAKSLQFNIIKNEKVDVIVTNVNEISLDQYSNEVNLFINLFPLTAVNRNLIYQFIPGQGLNSSSIVLSTNNDGSLKIKLNSLVNVGSGTLRIIAADSFADANIFKKWIDVNISISDGSKEFPYQISSIESVQKMIDTNFSKYYVISGVIDLSKTNWDFSTYTLTGHITGNNAELKGISITYKNENHLGLFKEITGSISNIKISGSINVDYTNKTISDDMIYIGLLAGKNSGTIENVYVELNGGNVIAYNDYKLSIGGVVGLNTGIITTTISESSKYTKMILFKDYFNFIDRTLSINKGEISPHTIYIGGVAGINKDGIISKVMTSKLTDFNNSYVTAEVYINAYYAQEGFVSGEEAIGGICGYSDYYSTASNGLFGVSAYGEITAGRYNNLTKTNTYSQSYNSSNNIFYGHFNNVGGLVGNNELTISSIDSEINNPETQVFVRGRNYIGGAVGRNTGTISHLRVESLENVSERRKGLNASLVIGENYVGGIIGDHNTGSLESSYFISYLKRNQISYDFTSISDNEYFGDIIVIESDNKILNIGLLFGDQKDATVNYVIGIGNIQFISTSNEWTGAQGISSIASDNYAIYGQFIDQNDNSTTDFNKVIIGEELINPIKEAEELSTIEGFEFIYLPPNSIDLQLGDKGLENKMSTRNVEDNLAFYLFYYESSAENVKNIISNRGLNSVEISDYINLTSLEKCTFEISNPSILEIDNGQFKIKGTGYVKITVKTPYNINLVKSFYIYIVNYTNNISVYLSSNKSNNELKTNDNITFDATESFMVYFSFMDKNNVYYLTIPTDIKVLAKVITTGDETIIVKAGTGVNIKTGFGLIRISEDAYQFVVDGTIISNLQSIEFIPYIEEVFENIIYTTYPDTGTDKKIIKTENEKVVDQIGTAIGLSLKDTLEFNYRLVNTTKSISLSKDTITTEPYYETGLDVILNSLHDDETLNIRIIMIDAETKLIDNSFDPNWIKIIARYGDRIIENGMENERLNSFSISGINAQSNKKISFTFRYENKYRDFIEKKVFIVTFVASNKIAQLTLTYEPQRIINITSTMYDWKTVNDEQFNFSGSFSYIPSNIMIPGQRSLLEFNIVPYYTNYSYIEILNAQTNESLLLFDLFNRTTEARIDGAETISKGIKISKELIANGKFYLRTFLSEEISDNTTVSIKIILKDENGNEVVSPITKTFYVQHLPGVRLTIDGVNSGNTENSRLKLARGLSYDIGVWVKGYSAENLIKTANGYTDGELIFDISENPNLVSIVKNNDGTYKLFVTRDEITGGRTICITTYGKNNKDEVSKEVKIYIEIVEFVVKSPQVGDIVREVFSDVHSSAIGNSFEFEISLNDNILVYDTSNADVVNQVSEFLKSLSTGIVTVDGEKEIISVWSYQDLNRSANTWAKVSDTNSSFTSTAISNVIQYKTENGVFTMRFNKVTKVFSIIFTKIENPEMPTFRFKFEANYYYKEGVPTLVATTPLPSNTVKIPLKQEFTFDIFEKTDLRNPYPIYNYDQFMDMREGNYYILLSDITLPSDFKPIKIKIGGLDGNNHRIIVSNTDIISTVNNENLSFGLFAQTTEDTLLENIILYINGNVTINAQNFSNVTYGLLVGVNYGQITNCAIEGSNFPIVYLNLIGLSSSTTVSNNVGALVGINYGNITHSRVEVGISINDVGVDISSYMPSNLGGITAVNKSGGTIASSYVSAIIRNNTSSVSVKTGGVVAVNEFGGRIFTTYISGNYLSSNSSFADDNESTTAKIVYSGASAGAFIYENSGVILNCYANIPMKTNGASSGFVYQNKENGKISYCYSTSLVKENDAGNSSFVGIWTDGTILNDGEIINCFSLEDSEIDPKTERTYNSGIGSNAGIKGLSVIKKNKFTKETFSKFAVSQTSDKSDGIWFWPAADMETVFIRNGNYMSFKAGRPELVAPNIISTGTKTFNYSEYIEETGITKYHYLADVNYKEGTKFNPYIIATTDDIEFMKEDATNFIIGRHYYRIICDLIYETSTVSSGLYKYAFLGNIEGNGFIIGNYVLDSSSVMDSAGFFATIGTQSNQTGSIKNLTFAPRYISLTNANCVGAVAGKAYSTTLVNILVDGFHYNASGVVILGKNCIGGVVGLALGNYNFNEIYSNISVNATYRAALNDHNVKRYAGGNYKESSYSGLIAGALDGYGNLTNIIVYGDNVSIAEITGLMFGYVGKNVKGEILNITSSSKQYIKADAYGGIVAGHNEGTLITISVVDKNNKTSFFVSDSYIPIAIGNLVGLMTGGLVKNATVDADLKTQTGVKYVGGAVGFMEAGRLEEVTINGDITAGSTIGGLVGQIFNTTDTWKIIIIDSYHNGNISSTSSDSTVRIGSVIGYAEVENIILNSTTLNNEIYDISYAIGKVNILLCTDTDKFVSKMIKDNKKNSIYSDTIIDVKNFAYSNNLQIWIGIAVYSSHSTSTDKGTLLLQYNPLTQKPTDSGELFEKYLKIIYNIDQRSIIQVVNPLGYLLNGQTKVK